MAVAEFALEAARGLFYIKPDLFLTMEQIKATGIKPATFATHKAARQQALEIIQKGGPYTKPFPWSITVPLD